MGSTLEEHRLATRKSVFNALTRLLDERSFDSISMADLAAEAGIGRTSIYNHFRDKDTVVVEFASAETARYLERLREKLADISSPAEQLRNYLQHHLETSAEFHFGLGPELYAMLSQEARHHIREHVVAVEKLLRDIITAGIGSGEFEVYDVNATVVLIHACLQPRSLEIESVVSFVMSAVNAKAP